MKNINIKLVLLIALFAGCGESANADDMLSNVIKDMATTATCSDNADNISMAIIEMEKLFQGRYGDEFDGAEFSKSLFSHLKSGGVNLGVLSSALVFLDLAVINHEVDLAEGLLKIIGNLNPAIGSRIKEHMSYGIGPFSNVCKVSEMKISFYENENGLELLACITEVAKAGFDYAPKCSAVGGTIGSAVPGVGTVNGMAVGAIFGLLIGGAHQYSHSDTCSDIFYKKD